MAYSCILPESKRGSAAKLTVFEKLSIVRDSVLLRMFAAPTAGARGNRRAAHPHHAPTSSHSGRLTSNVDASLALRKAMRAARAQHAGEAEREMEVQVVAATERAAAQPAPAPSRPARAPAVPAPRPAPQPAAAAGAGEFHRAGHWVPTFSALWDEPPSAGAPAAFAPASAPTPAPAAPAAAPAGAGRDTVAALLAEPPMEAPARAPSGIQVAVASPSCSGLHLSGRGVVDGSCSAVASRFLASEVGAFFSAAR